MQSDVVHLLREFASERGMAAFGIADVVRLRERAPEFEFAPVQFPRAIVLGVPLQDSVLESLEDRPTPLYFHHYRQANWALDHAAFDLALKISSLGARAMPIPASQVISTNPMRGHLSHRLLAWDAGLGWVGRSTLLVHPQYGARMRYVSVLTDLDVPVGEPMTASCGACLRCISACPAKAIKQSSRQLNLNACFALLDGFRRLPFIGQHICGLCVRACGGQDWPPAQ